MGSDYTNSFPIHMFLNRQFSRYLQGSMSTKILSISPKDQFSEIRLHAWCHKIKAD
jgi:hypothetical protein